MGRTRLAVTNGFATSGQLNPQGWFAGGGFGWNKIPVFTVQSRFSLMFTFHSGFSVSNEFRPRFVRYFPNQNLIERCMSI
jgi:hypothetical protein